MLFRSVHLWNPFRLDVRQGSWGDDREADEENIGLGIREGTETIIFLLTRCVPKGETNRLFLEHDVGGKVVKDGRSVASRESVRGE